MAQGVEMRVISLEDGPAFPEVKDPKTIDLKVIAVIEQATSGGKTGVALLFPNVDGKPEVTMMTAAMFLTLAAGVKGAMARFGEDVSGYP
jgi:hypothetical protein